MSKDNSEPETNTLLKSKNCLHNLTSPTFSFGFYDTDRLEGIGIGYFIILSPALIQNVSFVTCLLPTGLLKLMPIKDITNEEKSNLYMVGKKPKEVQRISESERGNC